MKYELDGVAPEVADETVYIAPSASVIGNVKMAAKSSIWFNATVRGDNEPIEIGEGSNIQDNSVIHSDIGSPARIGKNVTVGHKVMLHGCTVADNVLVGMGATILNNAKIGENTIVGANSLVTEGKEIPSGVLVVGAPAKVVRPLNENEIAMIKASAEVYKTNANRFHNGLKALD